MSKKHIPIDGEPLRLATKHFYELMDDGKWRLSPIIEKFLTVKVGRPISGSTVRAISNQTGDFASNVTHGYKLAKYCSDEELQHAVNSLKSRARKIVEHINRLQKHLDPEPPEFMLDL